MDNEEFEWYYKKYYIEDRMIQRIARKKAGDNADLYQELVQEGLIKLSKLQPKKATKNKDAWVRTALRNGMVDYLRKHKPNKFVSLDTRLSYGDQLEKDPATGELRLFSHMESTYLETDESIIDMRKQPNETDETDLWTELIEDLEAPEEFTDE